MVDENPTSSGDQKSLMDRALEVMEQSMEREPGQPRKNYTRDVEFAVLSKQWPEEIEAKRSG